MVRLAIGGNAGFSMDDREINRGGASFTVDTLRELKAENPTAAFFFLMGADSLASFHLGKEPAEICRLASLAVLSRGGHANPDLELLAPFEASDSNSTHQVLKMPELEISASDLRTRIQAGQTTRYQLHPGVEAYIATNQLYRAGV